MDLSPDVERLLWWATGLSLVALLATAVGLPWIVARLPRDYFQRDNREPWRRGSTRPLLALLAGVAKNLLGALLLLVGLIMLVTPGQGLLTMVIGLLLLNFPGKYRLERWLVRRPGVLSALNWLRARRGEGPFDAPRSLGTAPGSAPSPARAGPSAKETGEP